MRLENWQGDTPPFQMFWGHDGYIIGFRYRREQAMAWHITTVQEVTIHDFFVIDGRFHFIHETRATFNPLLPLIFETDDAEANPTPEEGTAVLAAIKQWEDAFDRKVTGADSETAGGAGAQEGAGAVRDSAQRGNGELR